MSAQEHRKGRTGYISDVMVTGGEFNISDGTCWVFAEVPGLTESDGATVLNCADLAQYSDLVREPGHRWWMRLHCPTGATWHIEAIGTCYAEVAP